MKQVSKFLQSMMLDPERSFRDKCLRDELKSHIISTVNTPDCGWETAICKGKEGPGKFVVVEEYKNIRKAEIGHKKWKDKCLKYKKFIPTEIRNPIDWFFG